MEPISDSSGPATVELDAPDQSNPFPGPKPYNSDQTEIFFGRSGHVEELTSLVLSSSAVLIHAPSGFGKSSLIEAGLVPALRIHDCNVLPTFRLGQVGEATGENPTAKSSENPYLSRIVETLALSDKPASSLEEVLAPVVGSASPLLTVMIIDQFEEIFQDPANWRARNEFLANLRSVLLDHPNLRAVIALRSDYLASLLALEKQFPSRSFVRFNLNSLDRPGVTEVISQAFHSTRAEIAPETLKRVVDGLLSVQAAPGEDRVELSQANLIQLQIFCRRLWQQQVKGDAEATRSLGDVEDLQRSMRLYVDEAIGQVVRDQSTSEGVLRRWMSDNLITAQGRRSIVPLDGDAAGLPVRVVEALEDARLLAIEQRNRQRWVELTHDSMVGALEESNAAWSGRHKIRHRIVSAALLLGLVPLCILAFKLLAPDEVGASWTLGAGQSASFELSGQDEEDTLAVVASADGFWDYASTSERLTYTIYGLTDDGSRDKQVASVDAAGRDTRIAADLAPRRRYVVEAKNATSEVVQIRLDWEVLPILGTLEYGKPPLEIPPETRGVVRAPASNLVYISSEAADIGFSSSYVSVIGNRLVTVNETGYFRIDTADVEGPSYATLAESPPLLLAGSQHPVDPSKRISVVQVRLFEEDAPLVVRSDCGPAVSLTNLVDLESPPAGGTGTTPAPQSEVILDDPAAGTVSIVVESRNASSNGAPCSLSVSKGARIPVTPAEHRFKLEAPRFEYAVGLETKAPSVLLLPSMDQGALGASVKCSGGGRSMSSPGTPFLAYLPKGENCVLKVTSNMASAVTSAFLLLTSPSPIGGAVRAP